MKKSESRFDIKPLRNHCYIKRNIIAQIDRNLKEKKASCISFSLSPPQAVSLLFQSVFSSKEDLLDTSDLLYAYNASIHSPLLKKHILFHGDLGIMTILYLKTATSPPSPR